ncbi:hypothetical protein [Sphingomonas sp. TDK1]|uniref:hypothetical protein n=1 Tax=Sphingomonas sp. TDK1 TaxID=453247 RepID=UPI000A06DCF7|nr:hypothetical protein [Sphingomonas sp. TDK1]
MTATLTVVALVPATHAQGLTDAHREMIKATGEADAIALVCGKLSEAQVKTHKAEARQLYLKNGITAAAFDDVYAQGFDAVKALAKAKNIKPGSVACQRAPEDTETED